MENKEKIREQFDRYILGQLNGEEKTTFEKQLKQFPDMEEELKIHKDLAKGIDSYVNKDIKERLQNIQIEFNEEQIQATESPIKQATPVRSIYKRLAAAAVFLLIAGLAYWTFQPKTFSNEKIFATYYQPYEDLFTVREEPNDPLLAKANNFYLDKNYTAALPIFEKLRSNKTEDSKLLLATGICKLETGAAKEAFDDFQSIIKLEDIYLGDQALWYAALAQVKQGNLIAAKSFVQQLTASKDADHYQQAVELLNLLD